MFTTIMTARSLTSDVLPMRLTPPGSVRAVVGVPIWVLFVLFGVLFAILWGRMARTHRIAVTKGRERLTPRQFFDRFYGGSGMSPGCVEEALRALSAALEVPGDLLRPTDRFDAELAPTRGWGCCDGMAEVTWCLEALAAKRGVPVDIGSVCTVDDFIRTYCRLWEMPPRWGVTTGDDRTR